MISHLGGFAVRCAFFSIRSIILLGVLCATAFAQAPAPEPLLITASTANTISLWWNDVTSDEDGFRLERFDPIIGASEPIATLGPNVTSYLDTGLTPGNSYYYSVVSFNANGDSQAAYAYGQPTPVPGPEPVTLLETTANTIRLQWTDIYEDEDGFRVERYDPVLAMPVTVGTVGPNITTFLETGLSPGQWYTYNIIAFNSGGDSMPAHAYVQTTPIPAPEPLLITGTTANTISLSWNDIYDNEDGFRIERFDPLFGGMIVVATLPPNVTTFTETGLFPGIWYSYEVLAFNSGGNSYRAFTFGQATPIPAPEPLLVTGSTANTISLSWNDIYNNEDGFRIERYDPYYGGTIVVATLPPNVTTFTETGLFPGNWYSYEVLAFNSGGDSYRAFNSAQATPIPAPEPLLITGSTANTISLSWNDIYNNEDGFRIERYDPYFGGTIVVATLPPNVTTFTETGLFPGNWYSYEVLAFNSGGDSYRAFNSAQATPIPAPEPLLITGTTANTISLSWNDIYNNEDGFRIERFDPYFGGTIVVATLPPNVTTFTETGLFPGNWYSYEVLAFNSGGDSYRAFTSAQATPIPAPEPLLITGTTANTISLSWNDIYNNEDGFRIERYDPNFGGMIVVATLPPNVTTFTETGLFPGNWYSYEVLAFNSGGDSYRAFTSAQATPIPAPEPLQVLFTTANTIALAWNDIYNNEDGFRVKRFDPVSGSMVTIAILGPDITDYLDTGLIPGNTYNYEVVAFNSGGDSYAAFVSAQATPVPSPGPLVVTGVTANTINLSWNDIYSDEDGFRVKRFDAGSGTMVTIAILSSNATTFRDTGLVPNQTYFYEVVAFNNGGESYAANVTAVATPIPAPDPLVKTASTAITISLQWSDIYSDEDGFRLERSEDGIAWGVAASLPANQTNHVDSGLIADQFYFYRVAAFNSGGDSYYSATLSAGATPVPAPDPLLVGTVTATTIALSWNDIYSDEDGFRLERSTDSVNFGTVASLAANATSFTDSNLLPNTFYSYRVAAFNAGGDSYYSMTVNATTLPLPPFTPSGLTATVVSQTQINLTWTDNANNETSFEIERALNGGDFAQIASVAANTTSYSDTVNANSAYQYRVRASNAGGSSAYSSTASGTTPDYPPTAPSNLTATPVSATQINLAWTDNSNNEANFQIESSLDGLNWNLISTRPAETTNYSVPLLAPSTQYYFRVRAANSGGASAYSNQAVATTLASTAPAGPSNLALQAISRTQINLTWSDNATNETVYYIERSTTGSSYTQIAQLGPNATSYSATGLSPNTRYYFRVRCWNNVGYSPYSNAPYIKTLK